GPRVTELEVASPRALLLALAEVGPAAKAVVSTLEKVITEKRSGEVYGEAAWALWKIGKHRAAVPALVKCVRTQPHPVSEAYTNWEVLGWLGEIGPEARAAVPTLLALLEREQGKNRQAVLRVLGKIDPDAAKAVGE